MLKWNNGMLDTGIMGDEFNDTFMRDTNIRY
jgi:hypothetical protein